MKQIFDEAKKQGFSVLLLCGICYFMFNYFKAENKELRDEYKAEIKDIRLQLKECQNERINDIRLSNTLKASVKFFVIRKDLEAVLPSKKERVFS